MKIPLNIFSLVATLSIPVGIDSTYGQGTPVIQHFGYADPTTEGFSMSTFGNPQVGPVINTMNAWSVRVSNSDGVDYYQNLTPQEQTELGEDDWTLSLTLQIFSAKLGGGVNASVFTGSELFMLQFATNSSGDPMIQSETLGHPTYTLSGVGSSYNNYQLIYDAGTETAEMWVDGVERISGIAGLSESPGTANVGWGAGEQAGGSQANWSMVSLSVPEPSTVSLILLGSRVLICLRHKRKN